MQYDHQVKLGERVYKATSWERRDEIFVGAVRIGIIKLTSSDRQGRTISLVTGNSKAGRAIQWCVEESTQRVA